MPITTRCQECGQPLRVPDDLIGKNVKCPGCGVTFLANAEGAGQQGESIHPASEPPAEKPTDAIREAPASPADAPPPDEPRQPLPRPQLDDFDAGEDEDDEAMEERLQERRAERRQAQRIERARRVVRAPAIGLLVAAGGSILVAIGAIAMSIFMVVKMGGMGGGVPLVRGFGSNAITVGMYLVGAVIEIGLGGLTLYGALKMRKLQSWGLAMTVSILIIVASFGSCCLVSVLGFVQVGIALPFGIWATVALNDSDVKASFT